MMDLDRLKANVFPGESGGDYGALFGYSNRPGGQFEGVNLTDMTVDDALQFANPSGPYGQWVKGQVGRVATPMGAYQVVGTTLRAAKEGLGLTGKERMTPETQDRIGQWIYQTQGPSAWEAWGKGGSMQPQGLLGTMSTRNAPQAEEPRQPFFKNPDFWDTLAIGLQGMTLNPNQALIGALQERIGARRETAQTQQQRNATAAWLESQGLAQLAEGVRSGAITGAQALTMARGQQQDPYSAIGKLQADLAAGRISPEQYQVALQAMAPSGMAIEVGPDGQVRVTQGPGVQGKPLTEGQSKDTVYATRAEGALPTLDQYETALTNLGDVALGADPTGVVRGRMQSTEYQLARQAGDEFLQAILRKDTGAAITKPEQELYGVTYLPQPGDGPEVIALKRQARRRALEAIKAGLPPSAMVAQEQALQRSGTAAEPPTGLTPEDMKWLEGDDNG